MPPLTLTTLLTELERTADRLSAWQRIDPADPDHGGLVNPEFDLPDAKMDGNFMAACGLLHLGGRANDERLRRANLAADHLLTAQRPSGNIDLLSVNYDSAPDTAFTVQNLCHAFEIAQERESEADPNPLWQSLLHKMETFIRRGVSGILTGGFHTPNHRWVIVSALVQAQAIFPDLEVAEVVNRYLAEGFDIDAEGAFLERSVGVYDAVNCRSLLMIAAHWDTPAAIEAIEAVRRNLTFDLHLLHADGSAETGLSRRQDYGTRAVPVSLIACYLLANRADPNPVFIQAALELWAKNTTPGSDALWLTYALFKCGDPAPTSAALPADFARHFPHNGLWRVRRGPLSATFFQGVTRLLTFLYGQAELSSLKISQTYFGHETGWFISDELSMAGDAAVLRSEGRFNPRRPGYELPLGRPVPPEQYQALLAERPMRHLPPALSTLTATEIEGGLNLRYQTLDGIDGVAAQIAFDFPPGGIWETADTRLQPQAGQIIFLKQGLGTMRYGNHAIEIGPGAYGHGMWAMREAQTAPSHVRILLTYRLPVDVTVTLRGIEA